MGTINTNGKLSWLSRKKKPILFNMVPFLFVHRKNETKKKMAESIEINKNIIPEQMAEDLSQTAMPKIVNLPFPAAELHLERQAINQIMKRKCLHEKAINIESANAIFEIDWLEEIRLKNVINQSILKYRSYTNTKKPLCRVFTEFCHTIFELNHSIEMLTSMSSNYIPILKPVQIAITNDINYLRKSYCIFDVHSDCIRHDTIKIEMENTTDTE